MRPAVDPGNPSTALLETVVHLFPGQGDFALGPLVRAVGRGGVLRPAAVEVFEQVDPVAVERGLVPLGPWLLGPAPPGGRELARAGPGAIQLALFGASMTVHQALCAAFGRPRAVVGVSFGEIAALTGAGVLTMADGARVAHDLALVLAHCPGGMTLLPCSESAALRLLDRAGARGTAVACVNDADETVVSGPLEELAAVEAHAAKEGLDAVRLRLPFASHHPALESQAREFARAARRYPVGAGRTTVYSAVAGRAYGPGDVLSARLADCLTRPARLPGVLRQVAELGPAAYFEAGTGGALARSARRVLAGRAPAVHAPLADAGFVW